MKPQSDHDNRLAGMRILVADDEFLIAAAIEDSLRDAGAEIVSAATFPAAMAAAADKKLSAAVLDVRLGRHTTEYVADKLAACAVPFLFYSGHTLPESIREKHPNAKILFKPTRQNAIIEAILSAKH